MPILYPLKPVRNIQGYNSADDGTNVFTRPEDQAEWVDRYNWLDKAYYGEPYELGDVTALNLFRALDESGDSIGDTQRLVQDWRFVVDVDAAAIAGHALKLEPSTEGQDISEAQDVWTRSQVQEEKGRWATDCAALGDICLEAMPVERNGQRVGVLVLRDPRHVVLTYDDETNTRIVRAVITIPIEAAAEVDSDGNQVEDGRLHKHVRVLTEDRIDVWENGEKDEDMSGPHKLGVVPLVHIPFQPCVGDREHGMPAPHGLEQALAHVDSAFSQIKAVGNRFANPIMAVFGALLGEGSDVLKLGRIMSGMETDADVKYVESNLSGASSLIDAAEKLRMMARDTMPEFLFAGAGASASGAALRFRSALFILKMEEVRGRFYSALARVTEYAVAMGAGVAWDADAMPLTVAGGPILPVDMKTELEMLEVAKGLGLSSVDIVRHLQRLELVAPSVDPKEYAQAEDDLRADRATQFFQPAVGDESEE
jgi:hypothetical protein